MDIDKKFRDAPCIYKIININDNKIYVGKTKCLLQRAYQYNSDFREQREHHINRYLLNAMNKHGFENFKIEPIEFCSLNKLAEKELYWILELKSNIREYGYNLRLDSSTQMIVSAETSDRISVNLQTQWASGIRDSHGEKLKKAISNFSPEKKKAIAEEISKRKTKYKYEVTNENGVKNTYNYKELVELKLHLVLGKICRHRTNRIYYKNFIVERVLV